MRTHDGWPLGTPLRVCFVAVLVALYALAAWALFALAFIAYPALLPAWVVPLPWIPVLGVILAALLQEQ